MKEVFVELKKVQWPTFSELTSATIVTMFFVTFFAIFLALVDKLCGWLVFDNILRYLAGER